MRNVAFVQEKHSELDGKIDAMTKGAMEQATKAAADAIQAMNDARAEAVAQKKDTDGQLEILKKKLSRAQATGDQKEMSDIDKKYRDQFQRYCRKGRAMDDSVVEDIAREIATKSSFGDDDRVAMMTKDMVAGSNPDGGYLIRPEVANWMINRVFETSPMRAISNVVNIASDSLEIVIDDNEAASGGWVGEVDNRPETGTPKIGKLTIVAHEQYAMPRLTQKMLDDAGIDIESWLQDKVSRRFTRVENTAFVRGDGSEKPKGFLAYPDAPNVETYQRFALGTASSLTNGVIVGDDLKRLQNALKEEYQTNAVWGMKRATFGDIITLKATGSGEYVFQTEFLMPKEDKMLLGKNIIFMDDMDAVADDAIPVVYGDFGVGYTIVDRTGIRVIRDEVTEKPYILLYTTKRTGGDVTNYDSLKRLRISPVGP